MVWIQHVLVCGHSLASYYMDWRPCFVFFLLNMGIPTPGMISTYLVDDWLHVLTGSLTTNSLPYIFIVNHFNHQFLLWPHTLWGCGASIVPIFYTLWVPYIFHIDVQLKHWIWPFSTSFFPPSLLVSYTGSDVHWPSIFACLEGVMP